MKKLLALLFLLSAVTVKAQNSTDELLDSKTVKNYIHFSIIDKKLYYQLDENTDKKSHKTLPADFCVAVQKQDNEIALVFDFINPFKQKIILGETLEADGAYESLSKFYSVIKVLGNQVSNSSTSETNNKIKNTYLEVYKSLKKTNSAQKEVQTIILNITAKNMMAWKYAFLSSEANCIKEKGLFELLVTADATFYRKSDDTNTPDFFPTILDKAITDLLAQESVTNLTDYNIKLKETIAILNKQNTTAANLLSSLKGWNYENTFFTKSPVCSSLRDYTKEAIDNFVDDATILLEKRKTALLVLNELQTNTSNFLKRCDAKDNTMIIGRIPVSVENVKIETIKLREVQFKTDNLEVKVAEDEKKDIDLGKLRIRNYHLLIPEFALGAFYTDLSYPVYGTTVSGGTTSISGPEYQNYSLVAAAHLNLIVNLHGLVNPMIQFGVGTAKELPSFLAGGGIRLSKPNHLSISFGGLWTWKKELDKLKVGDVIANSADLDKDLKYKFITKPSFYLGINFGF